MGRFIINNQRRTFAVAGKNKENVERLKQEVENFGFFINQANPDFVISLGGDGTYLFAERKYPGIPKILIRDDSVCKKCTETKLARVLYAIARGKYRIEKYLKLEAKVRAGNKVHRLLCANDFVLRNKRVTEALRFSVKTNGRLRNRCFDSLIGDGVVIATPFGSTAYFYSITRKKMKNGIGLAFNNTTKKIKPISLSKHSLINIKINRNKAEFSADNNPQILNLEAGDSIEIKKSSESAKIVMLRLGLKDAIKLIVKGRRRSLM